MYPVVQTITNTMEVQTESNGIIEVVQEQQQLLPPPPPPFVNGHVNGDVPEQVALPLPPPPQEDLPRLYDMDLEKMHGELYKDRYLTPQDFLDDVGKIVHNAAARAHEDLDRLYRAQAMYTATEVSMHEFDPQLRMECERMAVRERKRREQHKKSRDKGKAAEENMHTPPPNARRSARNNGMQPELAITDPVRLERRLKRQRADGTADSTEEENGDSHDAKRSRLNVHDEDDGQPDPLDLVGPTPLRAGPSTVRFASLDPMVSVGQSPAPQNDPNPLSTDNAPEPMIVDPVPRRGFDAFLLNPIPASDDPFMDAPSTSTPNAASSVFELPLMGEDSLPGPSLPDTLQAPPPQDTLVPTAPHTPLRLSKSKSPMPERAPTPMPIIERTPTPLPDFHIDENLLSQLRSSLRTNTTSLSVEQLEQLRATCLGCVWRHRSEWDRDDLVRELQDLVSDFVAEIADNANSDSEV